jgi:hypothetical protein
MEKTAAVLGGDYGGRSLEEEREQMRKWWERWGKAVELLGTSHSLTLL